MAQDMNTDLSISDDIEYDPTVIRMMDTTELLYQILCWHHLKYPLRGHRLNARKLQKLAVTALDEVIQNLEDDEMTAPFAPAVQKIRDDYEASNPTLVDLDG